MPVTAKLSKRFYDALGEQVTNELVDWFNSVDAEYKSDLKALNESNLARIDARFAEIRSQFAELNARIEQRFAEQTRFMYLAWATMLAATVAFGLR